jgi:ABC-2 type transport system ATP-binding protein
MYKKMRSIEFVAYIGTLKGMSPAAARRRGRDLMERFGLEQWTLANVDTLSKGMQQKLQFIATIVHDPELLILDEPFSGLDPVNIEALKNAVLESRRDGRTILFSTHMMEHAERLCDGIFMIHDGRKVLDGPLRSIKSQTAQRAVRLTCYGESDFVEQLPYVERVRTYGHDLEVFLKPEARPQQLLEDLVARIEIARFDVSDPSLYDIFLAEVAPDRSQRFAADGTLIDTKPNPEGAVG